LYVRKEIDLTGYDLSNIHWYIGVDNAYALFLNGTLISSGYDGGYTYRWEYKGILPLSLLNPGNNIIAVALMDNGGYTTFDMMLESLPHCPCPTILWSTGDTTTSIQVTPSQTTKYFVTIRDGLVTNRDSVTVTVGNTSLRQINATICQGESYSGHSVEGNYSDTLVSKIGCDSIVTLHLNVLTKPQPKLGVDALICERDSLILYPGQFDTYTWQDGSHQNRFIANRPGLYTVQVTNSCGSASSQVQVTMKECEITFPSAFTPNNDGKNDLFKILGANNLKDFRLSVYNRWGETVFETNDFTKGWSGKVKGQLPDSGIFIWYCEFNKPGNVNRIKMKGTVMLIR
jgi:gliding motility-associated-like protein